MSAVISTAHDDWIAEVDARLDRWAEWNRGPSIGGGSSAEGYMRERLDRSRESMDMTAEVEVTEKAVARFKPEARDGWKVIKRIYLGRMNTIEVASDLERTVGFVNEILDRSKAIIGQHIIRIERDLQSR